MPRADAIGSGQTNKEYRDRSSGDDRRDRQTAAAAKLLEDEAKALARQKVLADMQKSTSTGVKGLKEGTDKDRVSETLRTKFLDAADEGITPTTGVDTAKLLSKFLTPKSAIKQLGTSIKQNVDQQSRLVDAIQAEFPDMSRKQASDYAFDQGLSSTQRYDTAGGAQTRKDQEVAARDDRPRGGFSDYVAARTSGQVADIAGGVPTAAPTQGDPNTMSFTFGGNETTFVPRAILGPQLRREELASREGIEADRLEAGEPGFIDQAAGIGSLISSIWGD